MKKQIILGSFIVFSIAGYSQSTWNSTTQEQEITTTLPERGVRVIQNGGASGNGAACLHLKNNTSGGMLWTLFSLGSGNTAVGSGNFLLSSSSDNGSTYAHRLFIDKTTGNTGIGTTAPAGKLEVSVTSPDDGITIRQTNTSGSIGSAGLYLNNNSGHNWAFLSTGPANNVGANHFALYDVTQNQPRLFISGTNGNMGLGTTTPAQKLDVNGNINTSGNLTVASSFSLNSSGSFQNTAWAGTGNRILLTDATGKVTALGQGTSTQVLYGNGVWGSLPASAFTNSGSDLNLPTGKLGIGISSPSSALDVNGDAKVRGTINAAGLTGTGDRIVYVDANGNLKTSNPNNNPVAPSPCVTSAGPWYEGGNINPATNTIGTCGAVDFILKSQNNSVWLKPSGNVGIGNPNPAAKLDVNGTINTSANIQVSAPVAANVAYEIVQATASRFKTYGNGSTYIGTFASPANDFDPNHMTMLTVGYSGAANKILNVVNNTSISAPSDLFTVYGDGRTRLLKQFEIGDPANILNDPNNTAITISSAAGKGIHFNTWNNAMPLIDVNTTTFNGSPFTVYGDGRIEAKSLTATTRMYALTDNASGADKFVVYGDGKTAIGTNTVAPTSNLEINDANSAEIKVTSWSNNAAKIWARNYLQAYNFGIDNNGVGHIATSATNNTDGYMINFHPDFNNKPQVWIGSEKPIGTHADFSFAVAGKIVAQSLYITAANNTNWADYVFAANYQLPSIYEVEKFYKKNQHLPEIPTAKEVEADGVDIAKMNVLLLKKIEELTIYMVEQQKQIDELKSKIKK
jgi:hypothetical protein